MREPASEPEQGPLDWVFHYHDRTKHHFRRYAASLGWLDWDTQPDPFRTYPGAPAVRLPMPPDLEVPYDSVFTPNSLPPRPIDLAGVSDFLFHSFALSAWKQHGDSRWALRVNPSSGNLHPTEVYLLLPAVSGLSDRAALHHYVSRDHALERRADLAGAPSGRLGNACPEGAFFLGLSSIPWRESWKYGERAWRYCQHDTGHALAAARLAASALGWRMLLLDDLPDEDAARILGLDRHQEFSPEEPEEPDVLALVLPRSLHCDPRVALASVRDDPTWHGCANRLSAGHQDWPVIDRIARACRRRRASMPEAHGLTPAPPEPPPGPTPAPERHRPFGPLVRRRRSALGLDGRSSMSREALYPMLRRLLPGLCRAPWDLLPWPACVHLGLFVHRVAGLDPGLYALARSDDAVASLRTSLRPGFAWNTPEGCPTDLPFFLLEPGDVRGVAARVSCDQDIAGDGCFSLAMLAQFEPIVRRAGAPFYRRLYWECGMIGQVLYLEAEAAGLRGTGIGCYFDDPVHEIFGIRDRGLQSLYHFTLGMPVEDPRLTTSPAYPGA